MQNRRCFCLNCLFDVSDYHFFFRLQSIVKSDILSNYIKRLTIWIITWLFFLDVNVFDIIISGLSSRSIVERLHSNGLTGGENVKKNPKIWHKKSSYFAPIITSKHKYQDMRKQITYIQTDLLFWILWGFFNITQSIWSYF